MSSYMPNLVKVYKLNMGSLLYVSCTLHKATQMSAQEKEAKRMTRLCVG